MKYILIFLCVIEVLLITYTRNIAGPYFSPLLLLTTSVSIAFVFFKNARSEKVEKDVVKIAPNPGIFTAISTLIFLGISAYVFCCLFKLWSTYTFTENSVEQSDIIPQIMTLVKRFLSHRPVYIPIRWNYTLYPTYLPLLWMPYIPAEVLKVDYRWIPAITLWLSCVYFFINKFKTTISFRYVWSFVLPVWPLLIWLVLIKYDPYTFVVTVEELVAGYYLFTIMCLRQGKIVPFAMGIAFCLLSRYSIILWMPLCLFCFYFAGQKRAALIIASVIMLFFIFCYWLPFLKSDPGIFLRGYQYYTKDAQYNWSFGNFIYNGMGFGAWVMKFVPGDIAFKVNTYQKIHLFLCVITVIGLMLYYNKTKNKYDFKSYLLFSFKIYISIFYYFVQVPYNYLFILPVLMSSSLLPSNIFKYKNYEKKN